jgi:hypothetical protein
MLHENREALGRQMKHRLESGADIPAVDGEFLHAQGEKLPHRATAGFTGIGTEFLPISSIELCQ